MGSLACPPECEVLCRILWLSGCRTVSVGVHLSVRKAHVPSQPAAFGVLCGDRLACEAACLVDMHPGPTCDTAVVAVQRFKHTAPDTCDADAWEALHVYLSAKCCVRPCGCEGVRLYLLVYTYLLQPIGQGTRAFRASGFRMLGGDRIAFEAACLVDTHPGPTLDTAVGAV
jgi:hypothetical protein